MASKKKAAKKSGKKTNDESAEKIVASINRFLKNNLHTFTLTDLHIRPMGAGLVCNRNEVKKMVRQDDGSYRLECVPV